MSVVLSETTGANVIRNVHAPRGIHAHKDAGGAWEWMVQDGLGSVRGMVDANSSLTEVRLYEPYGQPVSATPYTYAATPYGFTGELRDWGNHLLYLRARYYDPLLGVFTALDPFEGTLNRPMSLNGYLYVEGNVPNAVDPSGQCLSTSVLQSNISQTSQSSCPPSTSGTSCQNFISEVRCIIEMIKQQLKEYCNTNWLECAINPPNEATVTVDILAGYYSGVTVTNVYNWWPQIPNPDAPERYETELYNAAGEYEWDSPALQNNSLGRELRSKYGFRRAYFANTHHYFGYLKYAYYYSNVPGWAFNDWVERLTMDKAIRDIEERIDAGQPIDDQLKRYRQWVYVEALNDLYIVARAADVARLIGMFGVDLLPDALQSEWCTNGQDDDVWSLDSKVMEFYHYFPEWYWPENVEQRYRRGSC